MSYLSWGPENKGGLIADVIFYRALLRDRAADISQNTGDSIAELSRTVFDHSTSDMTGVTMMIVVPVGTGLVGFFASRRLYQEKFRSFHRINS
jgi:hypothetical protein